MVNETSIEIKEKIKNIWDDCGSDYDNDYAHGLKSDQEKEEWLKLLDNIVPQKQSDILDVGAGTGFLSLLLGELGHHCKGIDLSEGMLAKAREKVKKSRLTGINFYIGDAENLDEPDNTYDIVINRHLVWTLPHPEQAVAEWIRVLKPGGRLIIIDGDWFYDGMVNRFKVFCGKCLVSVAEKRNAFDGTGAYDENLIAKLPMMHSENAKQLVDLVKNTGISIEVKDARNVEKAELAAMSLGYRLKNPYKRTIIIGTKP
ncbi:MAG: class I SAM-dependent methyltransferase [Eubacterium sp.]